MLDPIASLLVGTKRIERGGEIRLAAAGDSVVTVAEDTGAMVAAVKDFVAAYNSVIDFVKEQNSYVPRAYGEETAAAIIEVESAGMDAPYVRGAIVWCWADHAWPPLLGFQSLAVSPFGVLTRERKPKAPFHTCRRLFKEKSTL